MLPDKLVSCRRIRVAQTIVKYACFHLGERAFFAIPLLVFAKCTRSPFGGWAFFLLSPVFDS